ncbi:MAG: DivIVA domain-containing protein [bacterium]
MQITPLDIRKQTFRRTFKGFAMDDVMAYLGVLADQMEAMVGESKTLSERATTLEFQLAGYRDIEASLRSALVTAERSAEETRRHAAKEEEIRMRELDLKIQAVIDEASERIRKLKGEIGELEKDKATFVARFRLLIEAQLQMLDLKMADDEEDNLRRVAELQEELLGELERAQARTRRADAARESAAEMRPAGGGASAAPASAPSA